jgi:hypothetical protein
MKKKYTSLAAAAFLIIFSACSYVTKEAPPPAPAADAAPVQPKKMQLLFVQNADRVVIKNKHTITLEGVSPATIFFSDRPNRITGHMLTRHFIQLWSRGSDNFTANPPNATISVLSKKNTMRNFVVELRNPRLKGNALSYDVKLLQGKVLAKSAGPCTLFIDALTEPLTQDSYAGARQRMYQRGAGGTVLFGSSDDDHVINDDAEDFDHIWKEDNDDHLMKDEKDDHVWKDDKDSKNDHVWKEDDKSDHVIDDDKEDTEHAWDKRN